MNTELSNDTMQNAVAIRLHLAKTQPRYCIECAIKRYQVESREKLIAHLTEHGIAFTLLTEEDDAQLFGKVCTRCHAPLSDWLECNFCHDIWWNGTDSHMCDDLRRAMRRGNDDNWLVTSYRQNAIPD